MTFGAIAEFIDVSKVFSWLRLPNSWGNIKHTQGVKVDSDLRIHLRPENTFKTTPCNLRAQFFDEVFEILEKLKWSDPEQSDQYASVSAEKSQVDKGIFLRSILKFFLFRPSPSLYTCPNCSSRRKGVLLPMMKAQTSRSSDVCQTFIISNTML